MSDEGRAEKQKEEAKEEEEGGGEREAEGNEKARGEENAGGGGEGERESEGERERDRHSGRSRDRRERSRERDRRDRDRRDRDRRDSSRERRDSSSRDRRGSSRDRRDSSRDRRGSSRDRRDSSPRDRRGSSRDRRGSSRDRRDSSRDRRERDSLERRDSEAEVSGERKRKKPKWDVDASGKSVSSAPTSTMPNVAQLQAMQQAAMMNAVLQQQAALTRRARRLHVGNLPPGMTVDALKELFNTTMQAASLASDSQPCVNDVHMASDNRFAFVEFRSAFECSNALVLDGMQLLGKPLRVARPNDYQPAPAELVKVLIPASVSAAVTSSALPPQATGMLSLLGGGASPLSTALASGQVGLPGMSGGGLGGVLGGISGISGASLAALSASGGTHANQMALSRRARRLHVGNLPLGVGLTTEMLKQFFNAALVSANLHDTSLSPPEPVVDAMLGTESKFGFIEFRTIAECNSCVALNNIELGGKQLRIERPRDYAPMPESSLDELRKAGILGNTSVSPDGRDLLAPAASAAAPAAPALGSLCSLTMGGASSASSAAPAPLDLRAPTEVVVLQNMVTAEEAASADEMAEILEDTRGECAKHGAVVQCLSPKPGSGGPPGSEIASDRIKMRVYVKFEAQAAAVACAKELHGKMFDKRAVSATFISAATFDSIRILPCYTA
ncbi:hypothetical protein AB1Y20_020629 [Prymnesium parvum]|uniref:RRM domain-containing protein n=1 Tax=Prymnesium parvum TaxID=97485 RepID=A0AB34JXF3_PRYPA